MLRKGRLSGDETACRKYEDADFLHSVRVSWAIAELMLSSLKYKVK